MSEDNEMMRIKNISAMAKHLGKDVAKHRGIPLKNMKNYIKPSEIKSLINLYAERDKYGDLLVNNNILQRICNEIDSWVLGIELAKMASNDILETYWDDKTNGMVFKHKEKNNGKETI